MLCSCRFEKTVNKLMFLDQIAGYLEFLLQVYRNYSFHLFDIDPHNEIYCFAMVRKSLSIHEEVLFLSRHPIYFVQDTVAKSSILLQVLASVATAYVRFCCVVNNQKTSEKNIFLTILTLEGFFIITNSFIVAETYSFLICRYLWRK